LGWTRIGSLEHLSVSLLDLMEIYHNSFYERR